MHIRGNESGASMIKLLIILSVVATVVYVGYKLLPMYMDYERMKDEMTMKASMAQVLKDEEILADLVKKAKELELPLGAENFILRRDDEHHRMMIRTMWDVEVHFPFDVYVRNYHFEPVADENTQRVRK
jgi:hypothetical protein